MMAQSTALMDALDTALSLLDQLPVLLPALQEMGRRHVGYGVLAEHYPPVGAALLKTLAAGLGEAWTPEAEAAWTKVRMLRAQSGLNLLGA
jgi:hemoglobin-like flavoprotein